MGNCPALLEGEIGERGWILWPLGPSLCVLVCSVKGPEYCFILKMRSRPGQAVRLCNCNYVIIKYLKAFYDRRYIKHWITEVALFC